MNKSFAIVILLIFSEASAQKIIGVQDSTGLKHYFSGSEYRSATIIKSDKSFGFPVARKVEANMSEGISPENSRLIKFNNSLFTKLLKAQISKFDIPTAYTFRYLAHVNLNNTIDSLCFYITSPDTANLAAVNFRAKQTIVVPDDPLKREINRALANALKQQHLLKDVNLSYELSNYLTIRKKTVDYTSYLEQLHDTVTSVSLKDYGLTEFPQELKKFKNLKEIDLADNYIQSIHIQLADFPALETLTLQNNLLTDNSVTFSGKIRLRNLNLSQNFFTEVPKNTAKANNLLMANCFISKMTAKDIKRVRKVEFLNLYGNQISVLPSSILRLRKLKELDLYRNELLQLPKKLNRLKNLETLAVSHNKLKEIPPEISKMKKLKVLYTHHNKITSLPTLPLGLETLDVGYNSLVEIARHIVPLQKLKTLDYSNNRVNGDLNFLLSLPAIKEIYLFENLYAGNVEEEVYFSNVFEKLVSRGIIIK